MLCSLTNATISGVSHFHPSLMFVDNLYLEWAAPGYAIAKLAKMTDSDKHSSLLLYIINYGCKKSSRTCPLDDLAYQIVMTELDRVKCAMSDCQS